MQQLNTRLEGELETALHDVQKSHKDKEGLLLQLAGVQGKLSALESAAAANEKVQSKQVSDCLHRSAAVG